ncbi:MAG: transcriptional regulator, partial [Anaerolineae bacterium]|nr:transcriptional regulator [Anaerolineae bacterium]
MHWYRMDLHLHTPGSADYQEPDISYVDILRQAELRGLDIIAFTDHNTVAGYRAMLDEIEQLSLLEHLNRIQADEKRKLAEYRRLLDQILVLPGFEFTATFGFHILGIFAPDTPIRQLEHILLSLNIPSVALDEGSSNVGASADVLTAYRRINEAGGIVIAAHANSSHGVAMRGFDFGGQTKIAYTQDPHLHALEITDLDRKGQRNTARFFDGTKPEYPRRMRCIQGSDAHRLQADPRNSKYLGVGDRITEVLLPERTFDALLDVFESNDFASTRPYRASHAPYDHVQAAREEGPSIVQAFHEGLTRRGGRLFAVIADVCAFANTNGGTIFVGVSAKPKDPPIGIPNV